MLSNYDSKLIFIDCLLIFSLIVLLSYLKETGNLNIDNFDDTKETEGFKNNKVLKEFVVNKKVFRKELNLNKGKNKKKETFKSVSSSDYYKSFDDPILKKV